MNGYQLIQFLHWNIPLWFKLRSVTMTLEQNTPQWEFALANSEAIEETIAQLIIAKEGKQGAVAFGNMVYMPRRTANGWRVREVYALSI